MLEVACSRLRSPNGKARCSEFAGVGNYERLHGTVFGELDPTHRLNASIVNLDKGARNPRGHVEYQSDFRILKPLDLDRGNGCLVYDVPNRGNQPIMARLNSAPFRAVGLTSTFVQPLLFSTAVERPKNIALISGSRFGLPFSRRR